MNGYIKFGIITASVGMVITGLGLASVATGKANYILLNALTKP